ncbi:hypothetical protein HRE53_04560 [Acaryochloris sp. 'Moss Beach']|uniref:hypothetical protein n=1 Tax=Acaryochloris TaxID=155977 RepID=UPI001BAECAA5|nr:MULTISPECIES: hypothetical protein [Acaryochloris]QUY41216.1 hypothetical protein I1H34_18295 [Acaryochloris marina S15]UJB70388.1 hypothetical protein HRE53_04560 [Acaryochloris sp. 'Moss Beach']
MASSKNNAAIENGNMSAITTIIVTVVSLFVVGLIFAVLVKTSTVCDADSAYFSLRTLSCRPLG